MAPRKAVKIDAVTVTAAALRNCKCAADYHTVEAATEPDNLNAAWRRLTEQEQLRITMLVNTDTQPAPQAIADELLACGTKIQLEAVKAGYGDVAVKAAWKLLSETERDRIKSLCHNGHREEADQLEYLDTSLIPSHYPENVAKVDAWLLDRQELMKPQQPAKKPSLIELTSELRDLDNLLDSIDGDIPADVQVAVDELLAQRNDTNEAVLEKLDNYCGLIQSRLLWATARKTEADRLAKLADSDLKTVDFLKGRLKEHLETTDQKKLRTKRFNISVRTAGGKQGLRLSVESPDKLPQRFQRVTVEPDNQLLREALEQGDTEAQKVAYLAERSTYIAIN